MAQGRGNAGIAAQLYLSESSVEKHVNAIFTKLVLNAEQLSHRRAARESGNFHFTVATNIC